MKMGLAKIGLWGKPVVILGAGEAGRQLVRTLKREWGLGFKPVGVFDFRLAPRGGLVEDVPYGGTIIDALDLARKHGIGTVIFAMPNVRREYLAKFVDRASSSFRDVIVIPNLSGITTSAVAARNFAGILGVQTKHNLLNPWALRAKRVLDLTFTLIGGILILPLLLVLALLVWLDSGRPILYKSTRIVQGGIVLWTIKFRTMVPEAHQKLQQILKENAEMRE